jgi:hypothetical protein
MVEGIENRPARRLLLGSMVAGVAMVGVIGVVGAETSQATDDRLKDSRRCTAVPFLPENMPVEDVDEAAIQAGLDIPATQLHKVDKYAATCYVPATNESEMGFGKGEPIRPDLFQYTLGLIYDKCIVYGVPTQLIPHVEDLTRPAVVACIGPTAVEQI